MYLGFLFVETVPFLHFCLKIVKSFEEIFYQNFLPEQNIYKKSVYFFNQNDF